ncbi:MAG: YqgE/AlgH family protein [Chthoniobacterales bacterium]
MQRDLPSAGNMTGSLLIAHPSLLDPNFRRTILLLTHHSAEDGAVGVILNRPAATPLNEIAVNPISDSLDRFNDVPLYVGGPVADTTVLLASLSWDKSQDAVAFETFQDQADLDDLTPDLTSTLRAFVGYAGWSRGQLEGEIAQSGWIVTAPTPELIAPSNDAGSWRAHVRTISPVHHLLSTVPDDPSLN